jgi:mannose-6-phosphate isomerase-like protein (cupin superfamily)
MKTNHMQNSSATEDYQWIAASGGVKKLEPKEGRTKQVGDVRLIWKATGEDTGYATSFYEMDLPPGKGIPIHSHPYAEVFYVVMGHTDFLRVDERAPRFPQSHRPAKPFYQFVRLLPRGVL